MPNNCMGRQADQKQAEIRTMQASTRAWNQGRNDEIRGDATAKEQAQAQSKILNLEPTTPTGALPLSGQGPNPMTEHGQYIPAEHRVYGAVVTLNTSCTGDV